MVPLSNHENKNKNKKCSTTIKGVSFNNPMGIYSSDNS